MKRQLGFGLGIAVGCAVMAVIGMVTGLSGMTWVFGILALICGAAALTERVEIDTERREIRVKKGLLKPPVVIPFAQIMGFNIGRLIYVIPVNVSLAVKYISDGREHTALVGQGLTMRAMEQLLQEVETIVAVAPGRNPAQHS